MVAPSLHRPDLLIFATGVMGLAGAAELLFEASLESRRSWAACGVIPLMTAMLATNVRSTPRWHSRSLWRLSQLDSCRTRL